jgi:hypothetical protein
VELKATLKSDNAKSGWQDEHQNWFVKSFSVGVGVRVILILTLKPYVSVGLVQNQV